VTAPPTESPGKVERSAGQQRAAAVRRRRRIAAAGLAAVLAAGAWFAFSALDGGPAVFAGTWVTSNDLLGTTPLVVAGYNGTYTLSGIDSLGTPRGVATLQDGTLVASGGRGAGRWRLVLRLLDDNRQLVAQLSRGTGSPQIDVYTHL
jgi:hypothetical protein